MRIQDRRFVFSSSGDFRRNPAPNPNNSNSNFLHFEIRHVSRFFFGRLSRFFIRVHLQRDPRPSISAEYFDSFFAETIVKRRTRQIARSDSRRRYCNRELAAVKRGVVVGVRNYGVRVISPENKQFRGLSFSFVLFDRYTWETYNIRATYSTKNPGRILISLYK